jgi:hypothetical protein
VAVVLVKIEVLDSADSEAGATLVAVSFVDLTPWGGPEAEVAAASA